jgi:hypothetical protein
VEHVSILTPKLDDVFVAITVVERRIGADADEGSVAR